MGKQEFSIPKLAQMVASEADAYLLLEELRWGGKPSACPHCGGMDRCYYLNPVNGTSRKTRTGAPSQRRVWKCGHCRKQFSVLTGTIFHGSKVPVRTWLLVIFEMCSSKNGVSAREIERKYELTAKTAWFVLHRIREAMKRDPLAGLLSGTVIADETWIGGQDKNRHANKRTNIGRTDKAIILSLVHYETREVRSRVIADVTATSLLPVIQEEVNKERTALHTDGHKGYTTVKRRRQPRKRFMSENTLSIPVPIIGGEAVIVEGQFPITEAAWAQFMAVLNAMKPGLVQQPATDDSE
jgi:transposase-like protein